MMAIDGTWRRECTIDNVSDGGARLTVGDSIIDLRLTEFFLVLSSTGLAFRRCELIRIDGSEIGVRFVTADKKKKQRASAT